MSDCGTPEAPRSLLAAILPAILVLSILWPARSPDVGSALITAPAVPGAVPQDTRIVVNAPAFRMDMFENGKLIQSYKIGIGYPEFPLPTGLRSSDTIVISPTWIPPQEAWVEAPRSRVKPGQKIPAGDKLNPLGPIKIPIGLPSLIHGGKAPGALGGFASHGCVGLTNHQIEDFASRLAQLSGTQLSNEQIAADEKNKTETHTIRLAKAVPVELRYETITVEDGRLCVYRDVYARGTNTEEHLRSVLQAYGVSADQLSKSEAARVKIALKQMARDASGKPVVKPVDTKPRNSTRARVTRTIRGEKEVVIDIASLKGKGYPAPIYAGAGKASKPTAASLHQRRR
jgi:L,D-transpeptidase ErfK/SrfK